LDLSDDDESQAESDEEADVKVEQVNHDDERMLCDKSNSTTDDDESAADDDDDYDPNASSKPYEQYRDFYPIWDGEMQMFQCRHCSFQNDAYHRIRYHVEMNHRPAGPFQCKVCFKELSSRSSLCTHMKTHNDSSKISCTKCGTTFRLKHHLRRHESLIHGIGERKPPTAYKKQSSGDRIFECEICQKQFTTKQSKSRHKNTIHNPKKQQQVMDQQKTNTPKNIVDSSSPFACEICGKAFKTETASKVHQGKAHGFLQNAKQKNHMCEFCDVCFASKTDLRYHVMRHTGEFPFHCEKCKFGYPTQSELRKHQKNSKKCGASAGNGEDDQD